MTVFDLKCLGSKTREEKDIRQLVSELLRFITDKIRKITSV